MPIQEVINIPTLGRGLMNITSLISDVVTKNKIVTGLCNIFLHHTSASLIICENADSDVLIDLENFMQRLIPDQDTLYKHIIEGPDDMPAHIRTILTQSSISIPITKQKLVLGTWQGIFLWEHRFNPHHRSLTITLI